MNELLINKLTDMALKGQDDVTAARAALQESGIDPDAPQRCLIAIAEYEWISTGRLADRSQMVKALIMGSDLPFLGDEWPDDSVFDAMADYARGWVLSGHTSMCQDNSLFRASESPAFQSGYQDSF